MLSKRMHGAGDGAVCGDRDRWWDICGARCQRTNCGLCAGWMIGMRHPAAALSPTSSWNFGIGLRVDPKSQVLGDGIIVNQPLPAGESTIRLKTEPRLGLMLLSSFSF